MWQTWKIVPTWWKYVMGVVLVAVVLCGSACTAPGRSSSTPSAQPTEGERAGSRSQGNGGGY